MEDNIQDVEYYTTVDYESEYRRAIEDNNHLRQENSQLRQDNQILKDTVLKLAVRL